MIKGVGGPLTIKFLDNLDSSLPYYQKHELNHDSSSLAPSKYLAQAPPLLVNTT